MTNTLIFLRHENLSYCFLPLEILPVRVLKVDGFLSRLNDHLSQQLTNQRPSFVLTFPSFISFVVWEVPEHCGAIFTPFSHLTSLEYFCGSASHLAELIMYCMGVLRDCFYIEKDTGD